MPPERADAVANRERIMRVASDAFVENPEASLNEVAKRAGVGAGTLYRHFRNREDLLLAVYEADVARLSAGVDDVLAAHPPLEALVEWFEQLARYVRAKHGLGEALNTAAAQEVVNATYAPVTAAVARLLTACEGAGVLPRGHDPGDVIMLMAFLWRVPPGDAGRAQAARLTDLVVAGLRAGSAPGGRRAT